MGCQGSIPRRTQPARVPPPPSPKEAPCTPRRLPLTLSGTRFALSSLHHLPSQLLSILSSRNTRRGPSSPPASKQRHCGHRLSPLSSPPLHRPGSLAGDLGGERGSVRLAACRGGRAALPAPLSRVKGQGLNRTPCLLSLTGPNSRGGRGIHKATGDGRETLKARGLRGAEGGRATPVARAHCVGKRRTARDLSCWRKDVHCRRRRTAAACHATRQASSFFFPPRVARWRGGLAGRGNGPKRSPTVPTRRGTPKHGVHLTSVGRPTAASSNSHSPCPSTAMSAQRPSRWVGLNVRTGEALRSRRRKFFYAF